MSQSSSDLRIHIGNISPKLQSNPASLTTRIEKFGKISSDLEFHTKPLNDHYFAYVTLHTTSSEYEKLKNALNGMVFMGKKLSISLAKPSFDNRLQEKPDFQRSERLKRDKISQTRLARIQESKATYYTNSITSSLITPPSSTLTNAQNFSLSQHTFNNTSGNTKSTPPSTRLLGSNSYGSWTKPKNSLTHLQRYAYTSGGGEIIPGRHRTAERSATAKRQQTLRILMNGELKQVKGYKTKLWGVEKDKTSRDLTWRYVNGAWKSGDDHIIEKRVDKCAISGVDALRYGKEVEKVHGENEEETDGIDGGDEEKEMDKNKIILASLLDNFDFDKPVDVDQDTLGIDKEDIIVDKKGRKKVVRYDYEVAGKLNEEGNVDESEGTTMDSHLANELIHSHTETLQRPQEEVYYDEDDEGNDLDLDDLGQKFTTEAINQQYNEDHEFEAVSAEKDQASPQIQEIQEEDEDEDEPMPTFGNSITNNTETLRSLFNPTTSSFSSNTISDETSGGFKLALSDDDDDIDVSKQHLIDVQNDIESEKIIKQIQKKQEMEIQRARSNRFGLFWAHLDSPFLATQSQLSKIGSVHDTIKLPGEEVDQKAVGDDNDDDEETAFEKWFWSMRGEISRECKRRRRDVLRTMRKKSGKFSY
ncbi:NOP8 [[Candida] subhashii]|uniref:NOP8 n=1 Tax=[Candida] subhashii TaxID=561895 RepID=A0A8J5QT07_9ASCO|nr:NOP8 [[Candida] subhashii]KAG7666069.1 NOP8 [[Candida] subhashii]